MRSLLRTLITRATKSISRDTTRTIAPVATLAAVNRLKPVGERSRRRAVELGLPNPVCMVAESDLFTRMLVRRPIDSRRPFLRLATGASGLSQRLQRVSESIIAGTAAEQKAQRFPASC